MAFHCGRGRLGGCTGVAAWPISVKDTAVFHVKTNRPPHVNNMNNTRSIFLYICNMKIGKCR